MLECVVVCFGRGLHVGEGVTALSLQSDVLGLACTHEGPLAFMLGMTNVACNLCPRQCVFTLDTVGLKKALSGAH